MSILLDQPGTTPTIAEARVPDIHSAVGASRRLSCLTVYALLPLATAVFLSFLAPMFAWDTRFVDRPIVVFVVGMIMLSIAFVGFALSMKRRRAAASTHASRAVLLVFAAGLIARLILIPTAPILEDDHYRYMWDGAVTATGQNPYTYPPARFVSAPGIKELLESVALEPTPFPPGFERLATDGRSTIVRINNPHITTIYPPLAQVAFAIGQWLTPWRIEGWKQVILAAESITFLLLLGGLRAGALPMTWSALYWWNPLVLKEFASSAHMDALLMPFLAGALWMLLVNRVRFMAVLLAGAAAIKFWPLLIVPALLRCNRAAIVTGAMISVTALALVLPQLLLIGSDAGLIRYATDWQRNALAFPMILAALALIVDDPAALARLCVAAALAGLAARQWFRDVGTPKDRLAAAGTLVVLLCLLSPTGYPWYSLWIVPFAVFQPRLSWLLLMAAAPAYYLGFWFQANDSEAQWFWVAPLLSAGPAWLALISEWHVTRRGTVPTDG